MLFIFHDVSQSKAQEENMVGFSIMSTFIWRFGWIFLNLHYLGFCYRCPGQQAVAEHNAMQISCNSPPQKLDF